MRTSRSQTISDPAPKSRCCRADSAPRSAMLVAMAVSLLPLLCPEHVSDAVAAQRPALRRQRGHGEQRLGHDEAGGAFVAHDGEPGQGQLSLVGPEGQPEDDDNRPNAAVATA